MDATQAAEREDAGRSSRPPRSVRVGRLLWILSPLLYAWLTLSGPWMPELLRAALAVIAVLLLPGWLLHDLLLPRARVGLVARIARAWMLSVALVAILGLFAWWAGGGARLGPVPPPEALPPPFPGSLNSIVWALAAFLFLGGSILIARDALARHRERRGAGASPQTAGRAAGEGIGTAPAALRDRGAAESVSPPATAAGSPNGTAPGTKAGAARAAAREGEDPWQRILRRAYQLSDEQHKERRIAPRWASVTVLALILIAAAVLCLHAGGNLGYRTDSPDHVSCLREMLERDRILPRTAFYADGDGITVDARKGFFHVALALVARLAALDPLRLWQLLPGFLAPLALIVFHTLARRILRSEGSALFATFLAFVCFGEVTRGLLTRLGYGNSMGLVLAWGVLALTLRHLRGDPRPALLGILALSAFGAAATHAFAAVQILFSLGAFLLAMLIVRGPRQRVTRRLLRATLAAAAGVALPMAWRALWAGGAEDPIHTHRQGVLYLSEKLFLISPSDWGAMLGGVGVAGVLLGFALWRRVDEGEGVLYLAALSLAPLLILLNPLAVPVLEPLLGYLVARFALMVPYLVVIAYVAGWMGQALLDLHSTRRVVKALLFYAVMVALLFPRFEAFARSYASANLEEMRSRSVLQWADVMERIDREIPGPAVILSDPLTGYALPALTRHFTVAVLPQHGSPADTLSLERLAGVRDVLSPYIGTGEKARICRRFDVDYVLLNGDFDAPVAIFFCQAGRELAERQRRVLEEDSALFRRVWDLGPDGALYAVRRENLDLLSGIVKPGETPPSFPTTETRSEPLLLRAPPDYALPVLPDTVAGLTLTAVALDSIRVAPGGALGVTLYWRRVDVPPRFPVQAQLRVSAESPRGPLWIQRFSKISRMLVERNTHRIYRHREEHTPLEGQFGCEHWPRDRYVVDHAELRLPQRTARSSFVLKALWMEETFLPNLPLRHLYSDEDAYEGTPVGLVEVY